MYSLRFLNNHFNSFRRQLVGRISLHKRYSIWTSITSDPKSTATFISTTFTAFNTIYLLRNHERSRREIAKQIKLTSERLITPLSMAVIDLDWQRFEKLIDTNVDVNEQDHTGNTALHYLVKTRGNEDNKIALKIAAHLLGRGASIEIRNKFGISPFYDCCEIGSVGMLRHLISWGARLDDRRQINNNSFHVVNSFQGQITKLSNERNGDGWTPMMGAVWNNDLNLVNLLIAKAGNNAHTLINGVTAEYSEDPIIEHSRKQYTESNLKADNSNQFILYPPENHHIHQRKLSYDAPIFWCIKRQNGLLFQRLTQLKAEIDGIYYCSIIDHNTLLNIAVSQTTHSPESKDSTDIESIWKSIIDEAFQSERHLLSMRSGQHWHTPLHQACDIGNYDAINYLISKVQNDEDGLSDVLGLIKLSRHGRYSFELIKSAKDIDHKNKFNELFFRTAKAVANKLNKDLKHKLAFLRSSNPNSTNENYFAALEVLAEFALSKQEDRTHNDENNLKKAVIHLAVSLNIFENEVFTYIGEKYLLEPDEILMLIRDSVFFGRSIYYDAAFSGNVKVMSELLSHTASRESIIKRNYLGWDPLMVAIWEERADMVTHILTRNAYDPNVYGFDLETPMSLAMQRATQSPNNETLVKKLLDKNFPVYIQEHLPLLQATPIHTAAHHGKVEILQKLQHGQFLKLTTKEMNPIIDWDIPVGRFKRTPLHEAAIHGQLAAVEFLLSHSSSPSMLTHHGKTPFDLSKDEKTKSALAGASGFQFNPSRTGGRSLVISQPETVNKPT